MHELMQKLKECPYLDDVEANIRNHEAEFMAGPIGFSVYVYNDPDPVDKYSISTVTSNKYTGIKNYAKALASLAKNC